MGRKKKPPPDDPEWSAKFIEVAEEISEEGAEERFEEAMKRILVPKPNVRNKADE
jgi:hypothetical protein